MNMNWRTRYYELLDARIKDEQSLAKTILDLVFEINKLRKELEQGKIIK